MMYDELVKQLRELPHLLFVQLGGYDKIVYQAADAIEKLQKSKQVWIPVKKRLPDDDVFVLVCNDEGRMMIARHSTETYEWYYKYTNYDIDIWCNEEQGPVQYWMPLPEPPKEEN